jgi:outer membrane protein assembly factor BamB
VDRGPIGTEVAPVVADGTAVAVDGQTLVGVSAEAGRKRWTASLNGPAAGLATADDRVVVATPNGISAVSAADGTRQRRHQTEEEVLTPPRAGASAVAVGLSSDDVLVVDADTGERRWRTSLDTEPAFAPAVGNGSVSVAAGPVVTPDGVYVATVDDDANGRVATPSSGEGTPTPTPHDVR